MRITSRVSHYFVPSAHNAYRPYILRREWIGMFLLVVLVAEGLFVTDRIMREGERDSLAAVGAYEVIALTNEERADARLAALSENSRLSSAAAAKARDMAARGYFSHVDPDGREPWGWIIASGYRYQYAGENLAVRFEDSSDVVRAWMASPTHRANIIKPQYTEIGVGTADGMYEGRSATYVVQYLAAPATYEDYGATAVAQSASSLFQYTGRTMERLLSDPKLAATAVLAAAATLLLLALASTFFIHLQIQSGPELVRASAVAGLALLFLAANVYVIPNPIVPDGLAAAVSLAPDAD